jgi:hypothetical protein
MIYRCRHSICTSMERDIVTAIALKMLDPPSSRLDRFFFNPTARIYNLHLLLVTVALIPTVVISLSSSRNTQDNSNASFCDKYAPFIGIGSCSLILAHHIVRCGGSTITFYSIDGSLIQVIPNRTQCCFRLDLALGSNRWCA